MQNFYKQFIEIFLFSDKNNDPDKLPTIYKLEQYFENYI